MATDSITSVTKSHRVRLRIVATAQFDHPDHWTDQLSLIKSTGASFDGREAWYLWRDAGNLSSEQLNPLWKAVEKYGTNVSSDAVAQEAAPSTSEEP
ncbi:hypothetical protein [Haloactinomyces albus]|uniref:UDP-N-acetylmuramate-alanine ligase n=1 Tax=Haloactinomyces albus TaxID=1352928 RepID=A0AAE3ZCQ9_9ACTN|nr:hypothetical protein [Haloactinomyces albus]MDR7300862.1 UDP-N-acetylmuramate-alanine ligase [Haloactinomyces albus]